MLISGFEFWFYVVRLPVLAGILALLVWAVLAGNFYEDMVVLVILIASGLFVVYLIINNVMHLAKLYRGGRSAKP
ncbi:hypothetical protein [Thioalkalivibrio nitratireducens]|uniref:hypothetical protein n=1 Tax=Thioalkalivibrio nitratireducens TaxID=186931 RepID=UPI0012EE951F|nr:hypothetical protein [Thioalkalivibrio nitratireducens]